MKLIYSETEGVSKTGIETFSSQIWLLDYLGRLPSWISSLHYSVRSLAPLKDTSLVTSKADLKGEMTIFTIDIVEYIVGGSNMKGESKTVHKMLCIRKYTTER